MKAGFLRDDLPGMIAVAVPVAWLFAAGEGLAPRLATALAVTLFWQAVFARWAGQAPGWHGVTAAALIAVLAPATAPLWQIALAASFGLALGEHVFGGRGRGFVQPVALTLAFAIFAFADQPWGRGPDLPLWTAAPALALLVAAGQARVATLAGLIAGGLVAGALGGDPPAPGGAVALVALFLLCDPVAGGATAAGRALHGLLAGVLAVWLATAGPEFGAMVFAALLAALFAPLIDHLCLVLWSRHQARRARRLRHG